MMTGSYNGFLIMISVIISIGAAFSITDLYLRRVAASGHLNGIWLFSGSVTLGIGIWCMHFIGVLAYSPFDRLQLDFVYVLFSIFIAIVGSGLSLWIFSYLKNALLSSVVFSLAVGAMYYVGLGAIHKNVTISYNVPIFIIILLAGFIGVYFSLKWLKMSQKKHHNTLFVKITVGFALGLSVGLINYVVPFATTLSIQNQRSTTVDSINMDTLTVGIAIATCIFLILVLLVNYLTLLKDTTEIKKAQNTIRYMAFHDGLTGLYNRDYIFDRMMLAIQGKMDRFVFLYADLDQFKLINDALGQKVGDQLIKSIARRLKDLVGDQGEIGRSRGDEFLIYLPQKGKKEATKAAEQILESFSAPFHLDHYELYMTPSMGVSLYPDDGTDIEELVKKADMAQYQVKRKGKNGYQFYNFNQQEHGYERFELEMNLRKAVEHKEFQLYYQPKIDLTTGKLVGAEALIRWIHPVKGLISPGEFIPVAEELGLIIPIGEWVLRTACVQMRKWLGEGLVPFEISVNLSVRQFYQPNLIEMISRVLKETGLDPKYLELEITESMMADGEHALKILNELRKLGVKISLDDFGTGYSSLHYLKKAPIQKLKIDQSFIRHCSVDGNDATIVKTIIAMAHELNLEVIAEGVETRDHLIFLQQNICNVAQGYLFSKPVPQEEFVQEIRKIEEIVGKEGIPKGVRNEKWMNQAMEMARQDLIDTIRLQEGMTFKFIKKDGRFIHTMCDGKLLYRMGFVPEQIIGKELSDFLPEDMVLELEHYYQEAWQGELNISYEGKNNGISFLANFSPIVKGGKVVEVIASCVDITERKQMEEHLRRSEANSRLIAKHLSDFTIVTDPTGCVLYVSPTHEMVFGITPMLYKESSIFSWDEPYHFNESEEKFEHIVQTKVPLIEENWLKKVGGESIYLETKWIPILNATEEIKYVVIASRDLTEKKMKE